MKRTLVIATATLLVIGAVGLTSRHHTNRAWASMLVQLDAMEAERLARPTEREALYGETTEGLAWDHYWRALDEIDSLGRDWERVERATDPGDDAERRDRDVLIAEAAAALDHLHLGAHARDAATSVDFRQGVEARIPRLFASRALSQIACARMRALCEKGDQLAGLRGVLDAQQYARDLAVSPVLIEEMIGVSLLVPAGAEDFIASDGHVLSRETTAVWLDALDDLAASIGVESHSFIGEMEMVGREFQIHEIRTSSWISSMSIEPGWRFGFSWRGAAVDHLDRGTERAREVVAAYRMPPARAIPAMLELGRDADDDHNPLIRSMFPKAHSAVYSRYWNLARLSYLRHALALELGRVPCELVDPLGNGVKVTREDGVLRIETEVDDGNPNRLGITLRFE